MYWNKSQRYWNYYGINELHDKDVAQNEWASERNGGNLRMIDTFMCSEIGGKNSKMTDILK